MRIPMEFIPDRLPVASCRSAADVRTADASHTNRLQIKEEVIFCRETAALRSFPLNINYLSIITFLNLNNPSTG